MDQQTGQLINLFDFCQPIIDVYCSLLTNESAQFLYHSIYEQISEGGFRSQSDENHIFWFPSAKKDFETQNFAHSVN